MRGYQFAHVEIWSRQGGTMKNGVKISHRINGQKAWTVARILDEVGREPGACDHVQNPQPPILIPGSCADLDELRAAHEAACDVRQAFPYTNPKTGKKSTRRRALRKDAATLYSAVFSLPMTPEKALADPAKLAECRAIFDACIAFERARIEDAGGEVALSVIHMDEARIHVHLYALDRGRGAVKGLHPGHAALADAGLERGASRERATRVYCDAMRSWQDDLHREVMGPAGLLRFGPGRERLSRAEYNRRKAAQEEAARAQTMIADSLELAGAVRAAGDVLREREALVAEERAELAAKDIAQEGIAFDLIDREAELCRDESSLRQARAAQAMREKTHAEKVAAEEAALARRAAVLAAREAEIAAREAALAMREAEAGEHIRQQQKRADDAAARAEAHREGMARKEHEADAALAGIEAAMDGLFQIDRQGERSQLVATPMAEEKADHWEGLRRRWSGAKDIAGKAAIRLLRLRDQMLRETRDALLRDYQGLGAVARFAETLITRLPVAERARARRDLEQARKAEISDAVALRQGDTPRLREKREPER